MVLHPNVLKRAQEEIDRVVGPNRLPSVSDRKDLPYIEALVQETLRWENVVPVSTYLHFRCLSKRSIHNCGPLDVPHRVMEDDTYMDYHIPKGAVIVANIW